MDEAFVESVPAALAAAPQPLLALLEDLRQALLQRLDDFHRATGRRADRPAGIEADAAPHRLQLSVELLCKLEEQLLHPALHDSRGGTWPALAQSMRDVDAMRELAARLGHAAPLHRPVVAALLEGMVRLHVEALDSQLREADESALPWDALEREMRGLLRRWEAEVREHGSIEDEDGDPVGHPPR